MRKFQARWWVTPEWVAQRWCTFIENYPWNQDKGLSIRFVQGDPRWTVRYVEFVP